METARRQAPTPPMAANLVFGEANGARLFDNLTHFSRWLRKIGFGATMQKTRTAARALNIIGFASRRDVFWALAAVFVEDGGQLPIFKQVFAVFWCAAKIQPEIGGGELTFVAENYLSRRLAETLTPAAPRRTSAKTRLDAAGTAGDTAAWRRMDFEQMNDSEWRRAAQCVRRLMPMLPPITTRRRQASPRGEYDLRRSVRAAALTGGEATILKRRRRVCRPPAVVVLADISASMSAYSRMLAHFIAALQTRLSRRAHAFLFATELTPLKRRRGGDLDSAAAAVAAAASDWEGGTCIGESLAVFNRRFARRTLSGGAVVLLATDGLERGDLARMEKETWRLKNACRRLWWLNPLLRFDEYRPLAGGAKILHRCADETRSIHNVDSIVALADALARRPGEAAACN